MNAIGEFKKMQSWMERKNEMSKVMDFGTCEKGPQSKDKMKSNSVLWAENHIVLPVVQANLPNHFCLYLFLLRTVWMLCYKGNCGHDIA